MKILTKKKQKEILDRITILEKESILHTETNYIPIFAHHLTEISYLVGGTKGMMKCVEKALSE